MFAFDCRNYVVMSVECDLCATYIIIAELEAKLTFPEASGSESSHSLHLHHVGNQSRQIA